jgi:hypothetical protein
MKPKVDGSFVERLELHFTLYTPGAGGIGWMEVAWARNRDLAR